MSRTLSLAMPKKRQLGGIIGSTPQLSSPIQSVGGPTWMGSAPVPLSPLSQRMINDAGSFEAAKQQAGVNQPKNTSFDMKAGPFQPRFLERGGSAKGSLFPVQDAGDGKGMGVIGGGSQGQLRSVITGGYGAAPAMPGRIGYRGTLKERNPGGLAEFYAKQNALGQSRAARQGVDPVTRMSYTPTDREIQSQLDMVGSKYGPAEREMLNNYYQAGRTGDFAARDKAAQSILNKREELSKPIPVAPTNTGGQNPTGGTVAQAMGKLAEFGGPTPQNHMAEGGETNAIKPYIVNEKGEEAWKPDGEKPQLIPGKEKMVLFPKDGKVIPHGRTMEMAKKGQVEMPKHAEKGDDDARASLKPALQLRARQQAENDAREKRLRMEYLKNELEAYQRGIVGDEPYSTLFRAAPIMSDEQYEELLKEYNDLSGLPSKPAPQLGFGDLKQMEALESAAQPSLEVPPASPEEMAAQTNQAISEFKLGQEMPKSLGPTPTNGPNDWEASAQPKLLGEVLTKAAPSPEQIKAQQGYTPEEQALLAQGQEMTSRGISEMGPTGVKFASGGGIDNGRAFGPNVVQEQKPVTIRPGKVKDELGDVGARLAKQKEEKEFMKRWENDENMGRTSQMAQKREDGGNVKGVKAELSDWEKARAERALGLGIDPDDPMLTYGPVENGIYKTISGKLYDASHPLLSKINGDPYPASHKGFTSPNDQFLRSKYKWAEANLKTPDEWKSLYLNDPNIKNVAPSAREAFTIDSRGDALDPLSIIEAKRQQAAMEKFAKEAMAARNARRGRTKSFAK